MTKQELITMMGDEDKALWTMERILENVKADFVTMCLKNTAARYEAEFKEKTESGYYTEFSNFPEGFNLWSAMAANDPLAEQWDKNETRMVEQSGDRKIATFAFNMYVHALNNKYKVGT